MVKMMMKDICQSRKVEATKKELKDPSLHDKTEAKDEHHSGKAIPEGMEHPRTNSVNKVTNTNSLLNMRSKIILIRLKTELTKVKTMDPLAKENRAKVPNHLPYSKSTLKLMIVLM